MAQPGILSQIPDPDLRKKLQVSELPHLLDTTKVYVLPSRDLSSSTSHKKGNLYSSAVYQNYGSGLSTKQRFASEIKAGGIVLRKEMCIGGHICESSACIHLAVQGVANDTNFYIGNSRRTGRIVSGVGESYNVKCTSCHATATKTTGKFSI